MRRSGDRWMRARGLSLLLFAAGVAAAADPDWALEQLMRELAAVKESKAHFVERKYLKLLTAPLQTEGQLLYRAPDRLEKYTLKPKAERMVVEAGRLTIENIARGSKRVIALSDNLALWGLVESIRATLKGDLPLLGIFYQVKLSGERGKWRLKLIPRELKMQAAVEWIQIDGRDQRIESIEVLETKGDRSVMSIHEDAQ